MSNKLNLYNYIAAELPFIRPIYRTLLSRKRAYAAFDQKQLKVMLEKLSPTDTVLDPMSGYGSLSEICRDIDISTYCIEANPPSYLWQIFKEQSNKEALLEISEILMRVVETITPSCKFEASSDWFPDESRAILQYIWKNTLTAVRKELQNAEIYLAAIILPFLGRFSSHGNGTLSIHVKKGGIVFYNDITSDFKKYLSLISKEIFEKYEHKKAKNTIVFHNALTEYDITEKFSYMVTSPPYPNAIDYYATFFPENYALENIFQIPLFESTNFRSEIIGSSKVSTFKKHHTIEIEHMQSKVAQNFLTSLKNWKGTKRAIQDNVSYYIPYYYIYFYRLGVAYNNIEKLLHNNFSGYIVVVNNTARKFIVPASQFIKECWQGMGYTISEDDDLTHERNHVGSINPRAIGFKARHMEYVLKLSRN